MQTLIGIVISVVGSYAVARLANKAAERATKTTGELGAGELALKIAQRADAKANRANRRVGKVERWRRQIQDEWWPLHIEWDRAVETDLRQLDPGVKIPPRPPMPRFPDDDEDDELVDDVG